VENAIRLVIADVDGTLVTQDKVLTPRAIDTVKELRDVGIVFEKSGLSIAMGNASGEVQHQARFVTSSNEEEGFANAMRHFVLAGRSRLREKAS
jgi:hydroxymethylpyrimidine pyrophosphatase-like HAD family hydrolase